MSAPRLFLGNFDFEHRLADPHYTPSLKLQRLNGELATSWLAIANDGDLIRTPSPIDAAFFLDAVQTGLPHVIPVVDMVDIPRGVECVPWGWSSEVRTFMKRVGGIGQGPSDDAVRFANSRATSERLEREWGVGLSGASRLDSLEGLDEAIRNLADERRRWVVKAEFGMSARERMIGQGAPVESDKNWVRRRLVSHSAVFFEPWVDRIEEAGIQMEVPVDGPPRLIGLTPMRVDVRGQYEGSWFAYSDARFQFDSDIWRGAVEIALRAATELQSHGYFGPLGIDAMLYRDEQGTPRIRPLQDINARWTMGRLSLGLRRFLKPGEQGFWQHGSTDDRFERCTIEPARAVPTSPDRVGNERCQHVSRIIIPAG